MSQHRIDRMADCLDVTARALRGLALTAWRFARVAGWRWRFFSAWQAALRIRSAVLGRDAVQPCVLQV